MKVRLSHPERLVEIKGPKKARELLRELNLVQEAHLVIRGDDLVTEDELLKDGDVVEIRPVISGGSLPRGQRREARGTKRNLSSPLAPRP
jgi:sulfur carrier protein